MSIVAAIPIRLERIFQKGECVDVTFSKKPVKQEVEANYWEGFWQVTRGEAAGKFFFVVERGDISTLCDTPRATLTAAVERIEAQKNKNALTHHHARPSRRAFFCPLEWPKLTMDTFLAIPRTKKSPSA